MPGTAAGTLQRGGAHTERGQPEGGGGSLASQPGVCAACTPAHRRAAAAAAVVPPHTRAPLTCASWCVSCTLPHQRGWLWEHPGLCWGKQEACRSTHTHSQSSTVCTTHVPVVSHAGLQNAVTHICACLPPLPSPGRHMLGLSRMASGTTQYSLSSLNTCVYTRSDQKAVSSML
jgi:hypothetical protein